jgi:group I intron endonuclease
LGVRANDQSHKEASMNRIIPKKSGVYKLVNKTTGKFYIGQTFNLHKRKIAHWTKLRNNHHANPHLQNAWNKYGGDSFMFIPIIICDKSELTYYEQKCVDMFIPSYNIRKECVDSNYGIKYSEEVRNRMRHPMPEETKRKISLTEKGRMVSKEILLKRSLAMKGKRVSEETKRKISIKNTGRKLSNETKKRIGDAQRGKILSEEIKKRMSIAQRLSRVKRRATRDT